jgi:hypothetical protein
MGADGSTAPTTRLTVLHPCSSALSPGKNGFNRGSTKDPRDFFSAAASNPHRPTAVNGISQFDLRAGQNFS